MKQSLFALAVLLQTCIFSQLPTPSISYTFTNGALGDLVRYGTSLTAEEDRIHSLTDALRLNGDYFSRGQNNTQSFSVSFWVKTTTNDGFKKTIIDQSNRVGGIDNNPKGWYTYLRNGKVGFAANYEHSHVINGSTITATTGYVFTEGTSVISDGYWHNIVVSANRNIYFDGAGYVKSYTYSVYIDGVLENSNVINRGSGGSFTNINADVCWATPIAIGNNRVLNLNSTDRYMDAIDDINFYNYVLNQTEVTEVANENNCPFPTAVSFASTTVNSTIVSWTSSASAVSWDLTYVESGQDISTGTTVSGLTSTSHFINNLAGNTTYDVYLTSNCASFSGWVSPASSFTTLCQSNATTAATNDITIQLTQAGTVSISANDVNNSSLTSCGEPALVSIDKSTFDCNDIGENTVTLTAVDDQGNSSTQTAIVTVLPYASAQNINAYLDQSGNVTIQASDVDNGSNQVCGTNYSLSLDNSSFNCSSLGANTVTLSVNDGANHIGTATAVVTVIDTVAPTVTTQQITLNLDANFQALLIPSMINNGSVDNCGGALTYSLSQNTFSCSDQGVNTVTLFATDAQGNVGSNTALVTINPVIQDQQLTATETQFCNTTSSSTITTASSQIGVTYSLVNGNDDLIDGPIAGTGSSISLNTGTLTASQTFRVKASKNGNLNNDYALQFDGVDDKVNTSLTMPSTNTFTIEGWVLPNSTNYDRIISSFNSGSVRVPGELVIDTYNPTHNGRGLRLYFVGAGAVVYEYTVPNVLTLGAWNHFAVVFNGGQIIFYVNGTQVGSSAATFTTFPASSQTISFGEENVNTVAEFLNGSLDDIRFWNTARTQQQISENMSSCLLGNEAGLFAYYPFDEGTGTIVEDKAGTNDGTFISTMAPTQWRSAAFSCQNSCDYDLSQTIEIFVGENETIAETVFVCEGSSYTFPDGTTENNITTNLVHTSTLSSISGCDSIIETSIQVNPVYFSSVSVPVCSGSSFTFPDGTTESNITANLVHTSTLSSISGCDSIVETSIQVNPVYFSSVSVPVCSGSSYTFPDGTTESNITANLVHTSTLSSISGCDSIIETSIQVNPVYFSSVSVPVCSGSSYTFPDGTTESNITANLVHISTFSSILGCDSIVETSIQVNPVYVTSVSVSVCSGSSYTFPDGTTESNITSDFSYASVYVGINGCDSTILTNLTVISPSVETETVEICSGSSYTFPDGTTQTNITNTVVYTSDLTNVSGCDSSIVTTLTPVDLDLTLTQDAGTLTVSEDNADYQWINCENNEPIAGANAQTYSPEFNGSFACIVSNGTCSETTECIVVSDLSTFTIHEQGLKVYPNPATDDLSIESSFEIVKVQVFSLTGELVLDSSNKVLSVKELESGTYLVTVQTIEGSATTTFVKL